jgi:hypothetical protein
MAIEQARQRIKELEETGATTLDLSWLQLSDDDLSEVFRNKEQVISRLTHLYLHYNKLKWLPLSEMESLEALCLSNNPLNKIPNRISELKYLRYLFIDEIQLKNSVETIFKLKNLEITIWDGRKDIPISSEILSKIESAQNLINFESNEIRKLGLEIAELEESIKLKAEVDKYLDNVSLKVTRFLEGSFLISVIYLISANSDWVKENWQLLEPEVQVFSAYMAALLALFTIVLKRTIWNYIDELVKESVKTFILLLAEFKKKDYKKLESDLERACKRRSELID